MRRGAWWSQSEGGPHVHATGASLVPKRRSTRPHAAGGSPVPKRKRPRGPCGGGLGDPKAKEAPSPTRRRPQWSQSGARPLAHVAGSWVVPKLARGPLPL